MPTWTLDDIPWDRFDPSKVDPDIVKVVKAASLVEHNGRAYARYLCRVFADDPAFREVAGEWAEEEVQHGQVLARWAGLADPDFDFDSAFLRFSRTITLPTEIAASVRGSRTGELIARCAVEIGTSSYYSALGSAAEEPVLKEICRRIAADELRHYKLFYTHMKRYRALEAPSLWRRLWVLIGRISEASDDELAFAYYAANHRDGQPYDRRQCSRAYARRAIAYYQPHHVERGVAMALKAVGLTPNGRLSAWLVRLVCHLLLARRSRLARAAA